MRKTIVSLLVLSTIIVLVTGCFNLQKEVRVSIEPLETKTRYIGETVVFTAKVTMTGGGGVGDVFAAEPSIKEYQWKIQLEGGAADQFTTKEKSLSHVFERPGSYQVTVEAVYDTQKAQSSPLSLTINKHAPRAEAFSVWLGEQQVQQLNQLKRNQHVEFRVVLEDQGMQPEDLDKYHVKWVAQQSDPSEVITIAEGNYKDLKSVFWTIPARHTNYVVKLEIKDVFDENYTLELARFRVQYAQPDKPVIVGTPDWVEDPLTRRDIFKITVRAAEDSIYYDLIRGDRLIDRKFVSASDWGSTIDLFDPDAVRGYTTYTIRAVDGGDGFSELIKEIFVTNRPPTRAVITHPSRRVESVSNPNVFFVRWTGGDDPDFDQVTYQVYLGESSGHLRLNGQSVGVKEYNLIHQLVSGRTYWVRVDAYDGTHSKPGELHSFYFEPNIGQPRIDRALTNLRGPDRNIYRSRIEFDYANPFQVQPYFEVQYSKYTSFPSGHTFSTIIYHRAADLEIPIRFKDLDDPFFVRVRAIIETPQMKIFGDWSVIHQLRP